MFLIEIQDPDDEVNRYCKLKDIRKIIRTWLSDFQRKILIANGCKKECCK